ncbi:dimethylarginine dimethylaminohydrolase family protein [Paenibacillus tengchongensis]|uniref:dimethylarginine dimethylaminohydrolase family protein n=1 Tax=Paenibacillus tengchongensis TaxID=2608684 RepID=UPI00124C1208|nr:arginine deiminase family protein [Paenibacillus tengchongensis]
MQQEIYVESEFAPLRRVVLAESEFATPERPLSAMDSEFLTQEAQALFRDQPGRNHAESYPERQARWEAERRSFEQVLQRYGVEVLHPRRLTEAEKETCRAEGYSNFFVRDPFFTVGHAVVEGSLRFRHRRQEVLPVREIMKQQVMPADCLYVAVPQPEVADKEDLTLGAGPFLEGGDVIVLGKHVFVGSSGLASNRFGAEWLRKLLTPFGYTVELVRLKSGVLHLDCAMGLVREGLMIACEAVFLDGIPEMLRTWDKIPVTKAETSLLATNGLPINESVYVLDPAFGHLGEQLERRGIKVEAVDYAITRSFGGSFRCSTQPLNRS